MGCYSRPGQRSMTLPPPRVVQDTLVADAALLYTNVSDDVLFNSSVRYSFDRNPCIPD